MLTYREFEKQIFEWFLEKQKKDSSSTFSVRRKASKNAESDYFIGTKKSNYFGTTLWAIPVGFPGSSSDLIDVFFVLKGDRFRYYFEFNQTKDPSDAQNRSALNLIRNLRDDIESKIGLLFKSGDNNKMENYISKPKKEDYVDLNSLLNDLEEDLSIIIPIVDKGIINEKKANPEFIAHRINENDFRKMLDKLEQRQKKYVESVNTDPKTDHPKIEEVKVNVKSKKPLNQILFGPPGTGKTYHTINKAIEIINPRFNLDQDRKIIKAEYERLVEKGQIVFTTFHQSMSYEDFVEGIKPQEPLKESDPISYKIEEGIFKKACIEASFSIAKENLSVDTKSILDFSDAFDSLVDFVEDQQSKSKQVEFKTRNGGKVIVDGISQQGSIIIKHPGRENIYSISKQRLAKLHKAFPKLSLVHNIDIQFRSIIGGSNSTANWAVLNAIREQGEKTKGKTFIDKEYSFDEKKEAALSLKPEDYRTKSGYPFVLIIDEINRGNVSQIFGELITLIEEDKRLGKEEALELILPYSKDKFGAPPNLHIIGTMNTADRSIEALDTALRRRFSFVEMPPNYTVLSDNSVSIEGKFKLNDHELDLVELLRVINDRIEILLDRDHLIGHSYFMKVNSPESLKDAFSKQIIPLLQEYFYGDYGKISLVLGEGFCKGERADRKIKFAAAKDYDISVFDEKVIYKIENVSSKEFDISKAIEILINKPKVIVSESDE